MIIIIKIYCYFQSIKKYPLSFLRALKLSEFNLIKKTCKVHLCNTENLL